MEENGATKGIQKTRIIQRIKRGSRVNMERRGKSEGKMSKLYV